jgi:hypothetical protein
VLRLRIIIRCCIEDGMGACLAKSSLAVEERREFGVWWDVDSCRRAGDWVIGGTKAERTTARGVSVWRVHSMWGVVCEDVYTAILMIRNTFFTLYAAWSAQISVHCFCSRSIMPIAMSSMNRTQTWLHSRLSSLQPEDNRLQFGIIRGFFNTSHES